MATVQLKPGFAQFDANGQILPASRGNVTIVFTNGPLSGGIGNVYGYLGADFGVAKVRLAFNGPNGWRIVYVTVDSTKPCVPVHPQQYESHVSIARVPIDANDTTSDTVPVVYGTNVFAA